MNFFLFTMMLFVMLSFPAITGQLWFDTAIPSIVVSTRNSCCYSPSRDQDHYPTGAFELNL